jgi:hypothetical protein
VLGHQDEAGYVRFGEPDLTDVRTTRARGGGPYPHETGPLSWTLP